MLTSTESAAELIARGKALLIAGEERLLAQLPKGNWIGGTIPYFMTAEGGRTTREAVFVEEVPPVAVASRIAVYDEVTLSTIGQDSPDNGYTLLVIPAFSKLHADYALQAPGYPELFMKVIAGWIAGVHLDDLGKRTPKVFCGLTGEAFDAKAVALHVELPPRHRAELGIVNIFEPGLGDRLEFGQTGFEVTDCMVNGEPRKLREYIEHNHIDTRLPLVADFLGTCVNVSIQAIEGDVVKLYAPVFADVTYRFAKPVASYAETFAREVPESTEPPAFSCNCVLNYLYGELEGKRVGALSGPMTFGEIGYQLLNQTLVHVKISSK